MNILFTVQTFDQFLLLKSFVAKNTIEFSDSLIFFDNFYILANVFHEGILGSANAVTAAGYFI
jgi:hypothetical protein